MLTIPFFLPRRLFHRLYIPISFGIIFFNKKATLLKIPIFIFAMLVMLIFSTIYFGWVWLYSTNIIAEKAFDPGVLIVIPIFTIFAGIPFLLFFQNNPVRWLLAVRKLERGKIIFEEENHV